MDESYITDELLDITINIDIKDINKNINEIIINKIKNRIEGVCIDNGFIIKNSVNIVNKSIGKIINVNNKSFIEYNIKYSSKLLSPKKDNIINCYIDNINKLGIIAYIKLSEIVDIEDDSDSDLNSSPFIIIIPEKEIDDITKYNIGDNLDIKVVATRIKYQSDKIQIIAEIN
tara:strand:- start:2167 stop:2685 length:519 start_codon:yes stop_codon:yes gene_type:complete